MSPDALFDGWGGILRILVITPAAYGALVVVLRVSGKRTLAKLNAFDLVVTVAIGSTMASIITSKNLALVEGLVALCLLVVLQFVVTAASVRWPWVNRVVKSDPALLVREGRTLPAPMRRERITGDELLAAARQVGCERLEDIRAIYLESDGTLTAMAGPGSEWKHSTP